MIELLQGDITKINTAKNFLRGTDKIHRVVFVYFDQENYEIYKRLLEA